MFPAKKNAKSPYEAQKEGFPQKKCNTEGSLLALNTGFY